MARLTVTWDAFTAIAIPKRRQILEVLGGRRLAVTQIVDELHWPQPTVSKHLAILRKVGLVRVERHSRQKMYQMNAEPLKSIQDWTRQFERLWSDQLLRIQSRAEGKSRKQSKPPAKGKEI